MCVCSVLASSLLTFRLRMSEIYLHMTDVSVCFCVCVSGLMLFVVIFPVCRSACCILKGSHHIFFFFFLCGPVVEEFYTKSSHDLVCVQAFLTLWYNRSVFWCCSSSGTNTSSPSVTVCLIPRDQGIFMAFKDVIVIMVNHSYGFSGRKCEICLGNGCFKDSFWRRFFWSVLMKRVVSVIWFSWCERGSVCRVAGGSWV